MEEVCPKPYKRKKVKGQREEDLKDIPIVMINHELSDEELSERLGDKWKRLPDETPVSVRKDGCSAGTKSYMWAYSTGKMHESSAIVLYEYQKTLTSIFLRIFFRGIRNFHLNVKNKIDIF